MSTQPVDKIKRVSTVIVDKKKWVKPELRVYRRVTGEGPRDRRTYQRDWVRRKREEDKKKRLGTDN